jgi:hypothetical protein
MQAGNDHTKLRHLRSRIIFRLIYPAKRTIKTVFLKAMQSQNRHF